MTMLAAAFAGLLSEILLDWGMRLRRFFERKLFDEVAEKMDEAVR